MPETALMESPPHTLIVMDRTGDTRTHWDPTKPEEVATARETFERLRKRGYLAYRVTGTMGQGEQLREFDPHAGAILLSPPLVGG